MAKSPANGVNFMIRQLFLKAIPYKDRLAAMHAICLHKFRSIAQKFLDIRQYAYGIFMQSNEIS